MSKYHENQGTREEIDRILKKNAKRQANLGIEETEEMEQAKKQAEIDWANDCLDIEALDPEFWSTIEPQEDF